MFSVYTALKRWSVEGGEACCVPLPPGQPPSLGFFGRHPMGVLPVLCDPVGLAWACRELQDQRGVGQLLLRPWVKAGKAKVDMPCLQGVASGLPLRNEVDMDAAC